MPEKMKQNMNWIQVLIIIGSMFGMLIGVQKIMQSDRLAAESRVESRIMSFQTEIRGWKEEINKQMTDFHARLSVIEANRNK